MPKKFDRMERDILEAVYDIGRVGFFNGSHSPASKVLNEKYSMDSAQQQLTVLLNYLVEERYLYPYFDAKSGKERRDGYARGITPKGINRLRELQCPVGTWFRANWFGVAVAAISALIGIASIIVAIANSG